MNKCAPQKIIECDYLSVTLSQINYVRLYPIIHVNTRITYPISFVIKRLRAMPKWLIIVSKLSCGCKIFYSLSPVMHWWYNGLVFTGSLVLRAHKTFWNAPRNTQPHSMCPFCWRNLAGAWCLFNSSLCFALSTSKYIFPYESYIFDHIDFISI